MPASEQSVIQDIFLHWDFRLLEQGLMYVLATCGDNINYFVKQMMANKSVFDLGWISRDKLSFSQRFSVSDFLYFNDIFIADGWTSLSLWTEQ